MGWGMSQIIRPRGRMTLYKTFNTLWWGPRPGQGKNGCLQMEAVGGIILVECKRVNVIVELVSSLFMTRTSNGKSSIVGDRLYSFFFAFFHTKHEASFFRFSSFTQLGTKTFVLLRSCKIFIRFTSLCFVFPNFGTTLFVLPSILEKLF